MTSAVDSTALLNLVSELRAEIQRITLSASQREEVEADLATIEIQARSARPKWTIVRESLSSTRAILENLIASALFVKLVQVLAELQK